MSSGLRGPALGLYITMLAAACTGGSGDSAADSTTTSAPGVAITPTPTTAPSPTATPSTTAGPRPRAAPSSAAELCDQETIEEMEACWARNRQRVVERLAEGMAEGDWGVGDDDILRGPGNLEIDLNNCPPEWSNTAGLTSEGVRIVMTAPLTGSFAIPIWNDGHEAYIDYVNDAGGINGISVEFEIADDGYHTDRALEIASESVVGNDPVFAFLAHGLTSVLAVAEKLNSACVPMPQAATGHTALSDTQRHPWTIPGQLNYRSEAIVMVEGLERLARSGELGDGGNAPVRVVVLEMEDVGTMWSDSLAETADQRPDLIAELIVRAHSRAAGPDEMKLELAEIAVLEPDVLLVVSAGAPCLYALQAAGETGLIGPPGGVLVLNNSACSSATNTLIPAGDLGDGVFAIRTLPEGLTRSNLRLAYAALDLHNPAWPDGIAYRTNGFDDPHPIEGAVLSEFDATAKQWIDIATLDADGATGTCRWEGPAGTMFAVSQPLDDETFAALYAPCR